MKELEKLSGVEIPASIRGIETRKILHNNVCEKQDIKHFLKTYFLERK